MSFSVKTEWVLIYFEPIAVIFLEEIEKIDSTEDSSDEEESLDVEEMQDASFDSVSETLSNADSSKCPIL